MSTKRTNSKGQLGGVCKLCGAVTAKFSKSHIQPHWLVRDRAPNGDFYLISSDDPFKRQVRTGVYDFFLCSNCEDRSKQYDDYAATFFRGAQHWKAETPMQGITFKVPHEYDYRRLKLFMMNLLFKAAVTSQAFFETVKVEQPDLDKLIEMVQADEPGGVEDFTVMINMRSEFGGLERVGEGPKRNRDKEGNAWYRFDLNEFPCDIKANCAPSSNPALVFLKPNPPLLIYYGPVVMERMQKIKNASLDRAKREQEFKQRK